jgi:hypothetical protein
MTNNSLRNFAVRCVSSAFVCVIARPAQPSAAVDSPWLTGEVIRVIDGDTIGEGLRPVRFASGSMASTHRSEISASRVRTAVQEHTTQGNVRRFMPKLIEIWLFALYFSLAVPYLFQQIATGVVVPNDPKNLAFAIPVILAALAAPLASGFVDASQAVRGSGIVLEQSGGRLDGLPG